MSQKRAFQWTNRSVRLLAQNEDPIKVIESKARSIVLQAMDKGWNGPPFDPIRLSDILCIRIEAHADIRDARTLEDQSGQLVIQFNPNRPRGRVRFSVAHEIAHSFFPDCSEKTRNRAHDNAAEFDNWQLEMLCNIAASEIIMPVGSFEDELNNKFDIEHVVEIRENFDVSLEATLIRAIKVTSKLAAMFVASRIERKGGTDRFRVDYCINSSSWEDMDVSTLELRENSLLGECTAVGFTTKAINQWPGYKERFHIQCVGLPPYPGGKVPRVGGILWPVGQSGRVESPLKKVRGNALQPHGSGKKIIAHVVNDKTANWGGRGFAAAVKKAHPEVQQDFQAWVSENQEYLRLSNVRRCNVTNELMFCSMIAQRGYGDSPTQRVRYWALGECLENLSNVALKTGASVHMPMIGTGYGGGAWPLIRKIIRETLVKKGIDVTVYELPKKYKTPQDDFFSNLFAS